MSEKNRDLISIFFIVLFSIILYINTLTIPIRIQGELGSAFMPRLVLAGIIIMSLIKLIFVLTNKKDNYKKKVYSSEPLTKGLLTILMLFIYMLLLENLGFILSTSVYLVGQIFILTDSQKRNNLQLIMISVATPLIIYAFFVNVMKLFLPVGMLGW